MADVDSEPPTVQELLQDREQRSLHDWRYKNLHDAGFADLDAEVLACSDADLHRAVDLVHAGCDPQMARRILL